MDSVHDFFSKTAKSTVGIYSWELCLVHDLFFELSSWAWKSTHYNCRFFTVVHDFVFKGQEESVSPPAGHKPRFQYTR